MDTLAKQTTNRFNSKFSGKTEMVSVRIPHATLAHIRKYASPDGLSQTMLEMIGVAIANEWFYKPDTDAPPTSKESTK